MSVQVTNYKCPACTGPLHFVGATGKLECDYCGSSFEPAEIEALYADKETAAAQAQVESEEKRKANALNDEQKADDNQWDTSDMSEDWGEDEKNMRSYTCPSCGAELICEATTAATSCPYCGNPTVVPGQFSGALKPDYILPFKLGHDDAVAALKKHYKGKFFLPKPFAAGNHIEKVTGIYVPFWLFDGQAQGSARYEATRSRTFRSGNKEITETDHFDIFRAGSVAFEKIPVDASQKMPDNHMDSIEPYDYSELKEFSTAYLPGFLADKYDVTVEDSRERADSRCRKTLCDAFRASIVGYQTCIPIAEDVHISRGKVHYALMPVWLLNTKWNGKEFLFAMNGQTGKLIGDLPISWGRFWGLFAAIAAPIAAIGTIITLFF